ncbi:hypothetical protein FE257_011428 [Aspergillus nanangensis]|uniref:Uncharacterized protein n=1 Tax=Aspergillus nanangensis TaxID=2582783 RepID=A0AAD4CHB4_ASPNN|nr:hypothetical protein FE257_011428 [Aspergillus nanangensis]
MSHNHTRARTTISAWLARTAPTPETSNAPSSPQVLSPNRSLTAMTTASKRDDGLCVLTTLCNYVHHLWGNARFALEPIEMSDNKTSLKMRFWWLPRSCS